MQASNRGEVEKVGNFLQLVRILEYPSGRSTSGLCLFTLHDTHRFQVERISIRGKATNAAKLPNFWPSSPMPLPSTSTSTGSRLVIQKDWAGWRGINIGIPYHAYAPSDSVIVYLQFLHGKTWKRLGCACKCAAGGEVGLVAIGRVATWSRAHAAGAKMKGKTRVRDMADLLFDGGRWQSARPAAGQAQLGNWELVTPQTRCPCLPTRRTKIRNGPDGVVTVGNWTRSEEPKQARMSPTVRKLQAGRCRYAGWPHPGPVCTPAVKQRHRTARTTQVHDLTVDSTVDLTVGALSPHTRLAGPLSAGSDVAHCSGNRHGTHEHEHEHVESDNKLCQPKDSVPPQTACWPLASHRTVLMMSRRRPT